MKTLVVVPTYNERENIKPLVKRIFQTLPDAEVLVVDDRSPDETPEQVKALQADFPSLHLLVREEERSFAGAYKDGFQWAIQNGFEVIFTMDADLSHNPEYLKNLREKIQESDVVVGSRYIPGGGIQNWPLSRVLLSRWANAFTRSLTRLPTRDCTSGFQAYRVSVLLALDFQNIQSNGYAFLIEMKYRAWRKGYRIQEVPIVFVERREGASKLSRQHIVEAFFLVLRLWLRR